MTRLNRSPVNANFFGASGIGNSRSEQLSRIKFRLMDEKTLVEAVGLMRSARLCQRLAQANLKILELMGERNFVGCVGFRLALPNLQISNTPLSPNSQLPTPNSQLPTPYAS